MAGVCLRWLYKVGHLIGKSSMDPNMHDKFTRFMFTYSVKNFEGIADPFGTVHKGVQEKT